MQEQQAGLGGDRDLDFLGQFQAATPFEDLLGQENLDMSLKLLLVGLGKAIVDRHIFLEDGQPVFREWLRAQPIPSSILEPSEHAWLLAGLVCTGTFIIQDAFPRHTLTLVVDSGLVSQSSLPLKNLSMTAVSGIPRRGAPPSGSSHRG